MYVIFCLLLFYNLLLTIVIAFLNRKRKILKIEKPINVFISVVIAAKDEDELSSLLGDLGSQTLEKSFYELIVVDDHSKVKIEDSKNGERIIHQESNLSGKKNALTKGINAAKGNVIITVDGDCRVGNDFLTGIYDIFKNHDVVLSPGLISYSPNKNLFQKMQAIETAAIMGLGVSLHHIGINSLSNGANLAFKKSIWEEVGGYTSHNEIPSGDDEFFVQQVANIYPEKILFRQNSSDIVTTKPNITFKELFFQRIRWAGKWKYYSAWKMKGVAVLTFLIHAAICCGLIMLFSNKNSTLFILFTIKFILETVLIFRVTKKTARSFYIIPFIVLQFLYSPYVVFFGILSNFITYKWKGRRYKHG